MDLNDEIEENLKILSIESSSSLSIESVLDNGNNIWFKLPIEICNRIIDFLCSDSLGYIRMVAKNWLF